MVGCGGTGSHLLPNILQYIGSKQMAGGTLKPEIILIDGDIVEEKNLIRQRFTYSDLGENKAEALARRYSGVFGMKLMASAEFLETSENLRKLIKDHGTAEGNLILIGAVDNHRARALMWDVFLSETRPTYWVDAGNEAWHGQVVLGTRNVPEADCDSHWADAKLGDHIKGADLPCFFDTFSDDFAEIVNAPAVPQNDCARIVAEDPQTIHANMLSAQCASNIVTQVLEGVVRTMALSFDALTGNVKARILTRQNIASGYVEIKTGRDKIFKWAKSDAVEMDLESILPGVFKNSQLEEHLISRA
jgi:molybdopterin/thiamine biosynthesis adenylyltransferase